MGLPGWACVVQSSNLDCKVVQYPDTGSIEPGSGPIFGSVSGSDSKFWGIAYAKDTFFLIGNMLFVAL